MNSLFLKYSDHFVYILSLSLSLSPSLSLSLSLSLLSFFSLYRSIYLSIDIYLSIQQKGTSSLLFAATLNNLELAAFLVEHKASIYHEDKVTHLSLSPSLFLSNHI